MSALSQASPPPPSPGHSRSRMRKIESRREREVLRFLPQLLDVATTPATGLTPVILPSTAHDPVLTAFAQLASLKLNARRCLVSVFDRRRQLVIAEATKESSLSVPSPSVASPWGTVWLGGTAIPRRHGLCEQVLLSEQPSETAVYHDNASGPGLVVPDLLLDPRFREDACVLQPPYNRFYAGVPFISSNGVKTGVLCVFDDKPRPAGLDEEQLGFLVDLARIVAQHIESHQRTTISRRGEQMIRGLSSFFEGKPSANERQAESRPTTSAGNQGLKETLEKGAPRPADSDMPSTAEWFQTLPLRPKTIPSSPSASSKTTRTFSSPKGPAPHNDKAIFERAAAVIQKSVEADGVIFLDASVASFDGLVPGQDAVSSTTLPVNAVQEVSSSDQTSSSAQLRACRVLGLSISTLSHQGKDDATVGCIATEDALQRLLERYPTGAIFNLDEDGSALESSDDSDNEDASSRSSESASETRRSSPATVSTPGAGDFPSPTYQHEMNDSGSCSERERDHKLVAYMFPLARSVLLVPLWDPRTKKWVAGSFVWTNSSARRFTLEGELSYLRAFAATIMAEVDRADTLASDRAKSVLLGSLSHELRSPLHGIVAAVELIHDTDLSTLQANLLHSMDSCSRTLLDVIDHLLDYSKINTLVKRGKLNALGKGRRDANKTGGAQAQPSTTSHIVEVDALVEETVESVLSGLSLQKNAQTQARPPVARRVTSHNDGVSVSQQPQTDSSVSQVPPAPVSVYIDSDPKADWMQHIDAGAVRRLVMNLVGNAFKYTSTGFVKVSLRHKRQDGDVSPSTGSSNQLILRVADSGRGISPDFLRHRAFRPFSQEDVLSPGTGLGLSLVKDIVQGLHGSVQIESQLGQGTMVTVSIPVPEPTSLPLESTNTDLLSSPFREAVRSLRGLRVSLQGFCAEPGACGMASSAPPPTPLAMITSICRDWLELDIVDPEAADVQPDLVLCAEAVAGSVMAATGASLPPVVVVSDTAILANACTLRMSKNDSRVVETLSQPVGPRKLAHALVLALEQYKKARLSEVAGLVGPETYTGPSQLAQSSPSGTEPVTNGTLASTVSLGGEHSDGPNPQSNAHENVSNVKETPKSPRPSPAIAVPAAQERYLLVDDNNINLQILVSFMKKLGHAYKTATNGLESVEAYTEAATSTDNNTHTGTGGGGPFTHILMDISMPVMDGLEATRRIRQFEIDEDTKRQQDAGHQQQQHQHQTQGSGKRAAKIIALTGLASAAAQKEAFASGVDIYLTKPVRFKALAEVLRGM